MTKLQLHYKIVDYKNGRVDWDSVSDAIDEYVDGLDVAKNISSNLPVISSGKVVCPDCGDRGWLYDKDGQRTGTCPCHY